MFKRFSSGNPSTAMHDASFLLAGIAVGAGLSALLLPKSGRQTRRSLQRRATGSRESEEMEDPGKVSHEERVQAARSHPEDTESPLLAPLEDH